MTSPLLIAAVQVGDEFVAQLEELWRDRLVVVEVERPALKREEQRRPLCPGELNGTGSSCAFERNSDSSGGLNVLESAHERLASVPGEDHRTAVERDGDVVEALRHSGDPMRDERTDPWHIWATSGARVRGTGLTPRSFAASRSTTRACSSPPYVPNCQRVQTGVTP